MKHSINIQTSNRLVSVLLSTLTAGAVGLFLALPRHDAADGKAVMMAAAPTTVTADGRQAELPPEVRQAMEAKRYEIRADQPTTAPSAYQAFNPAHGMRASFSGKGFSVTPLTPTATPWQRGMSLLDYGHGARLQPVRQANLVTIGNRIEYQRGKLTEWYVNRAEGLEQGFTIMEPPAIRSTHEPLRLRLRLSGNLQARVMAEGNEIALLDAEGHQVLAYDHLVVADREGQRLPSHFEVAEGVMSIVVADAGAVYPVTIDPTLTQQAYLKASNAGVGDGFGFSVAVSGDTVVVGAPFEDSSAIGVDGNQSDNSTGDSGAAYVFVRSGGTWTQQAYLKASNPWWDDWFGYSVAISGDTIVVGAQFEDSNATGVDGNQNNDSATNAGAAYVFVRSGGAWTQQAYLKASNTGAGDQFGINVAVSGDTIVVGAFQEDSNATGVNGNQGYNSALDSGAAYVFVRGGGAWTQQAYIKASNTEADDWFGWSVGVSGDTVVVGAQQEDSNAAGVGGNQGDNSAFNSGAAYVFGRSGVTWSQQAYLKASNTAFAANFGYSIAISEDTVFVGAINESSNATGVNANPYSGALHAAGAAYVFGKSGVAWTQQAYLKASNTGEGDNFGRSVAVSGDTAVVGAYAEASNATGVGGNQSDNSASGAGAAYVFGRSGAMWSQHAYLKASNSGAGDFFGLSVGVSGDTFAVGASQEDSNAMGVNGDQGNNSASASGAVYVYAPLTIVKAAQSISFPPIGDKTYGDAPFALSATASSGLPVSFAVLSGPATLAGNTLTITGVGNVTVRASQNGDANYEAAADVTQSFTVQLGQLVLTRNNVLIVPPAGSGTITSNHLQVVAAGMPASQIVYTMVSPLPAKGQVKRNGTLVGWLLNPSTGHYYTSTAPGHRGATAAEAASYGAFLTTINNAAENVWITNNFFRVVTAYNGLNDPGGWDNGESSAYRNWYPGEPNSGQETAVHMYLNVPDGEGAQWNDIHPNERVHPGIVEKNNSSGILLSFTQEDIDQGRVTYQHFAGSSVSTSVDPDDFTFIVSDGAGRNISSTIFQITVDSTAPTADIVDVTPDPRSDSVATITIGFTEAVSAFDLQDLQLRRDGGSNLLTDAQTLTTSDNITWTLGNLSGLTGAAGTYTLTLTAAGSGITDAFGTALAGDSSDTWVVFNPAPQTITFGPLANKTFGDPPFTVNATASSGLPVSFSILSGPATIAGNSVTITGAGVIFVRASQAGNGSFSAATPVDQSFSVSKATATVALESLSHTYDGTAKSATTTTSPTNLVVGLVYSHNGTPVAAPTNAGSYDVVATVNDANYEGSTGGVLIINQAAQTITFGALPNKPFGDAPFAVNATASSGLPVTFSIVSGPATISGNTLTITGTGTVVVRASQTGDVNYTAAIPVEQSFSVDDTIAPTLNLPGDITAEATSAAGAAVSYSASANDAVGVTTFNCSPASGASFMIGTTTVSCSAADEAGNTSSGSFSVVVADTTAPSMNLPGSLMAEATGPSGASVSYAASADDLVGVTSFSCDRPSGGTFPIGLTTVACTAKDAANNESAGTFNVTIVDTLPPMISNVPADVTTSATSASGAVVSYINPVASDLVDGVVAVSCAPASGSTFPIGATAVTCGTSDSHNNAASASFIVTVLTTDLTITMTATPSPVTTRSHLTYTITVTNGGSGNATGVVITDAIPAGTDFVSAITSTGTTCSPDAGGVLACGLGDLASGASETLTLTVYVTAKPKDGITNTASVSASTYDPNVSGNMATVTTPVVGGRPTDPGPPPDAGPPSGRPAR